MSTEKLSLAKLTLKPLDNTVPIDSKPIRVLVLEEGQWVIMEQIFEKFLQGGSCLMVMQVALQRTLLSEFLFCTTKMVS